MFVSLFSGMPRKLTLSSDGGRYYRSLLFIYFTIRREKRWRQATKEKKLKTLNVFE